MRHPGLFGLLAVLVQLLTPSNQLGAQTLYATCPEKGSIVRISRDGTVSTVATGLHNPTGLAYDGQGTLYVACDGDILKVSTAGMVSPFATVPISSLSMGTSRTTLTLSEKLHLGFDSHGVLLAVSTGLNGGSYFRFSPTGEFNRIYNGLNNPPNFAIDAHDDVYVSNPLQGMVMKISGTGSSSGFAAGLNEPAALAFDSQNNFYVAEKSGNSTAITEIDSTRSSRSYYKGPGEASILAIDPEGNLYLYEGGTIFQVGQNRQPRPFATGVPPIETLICDQSVFAKTVVAGTGTPLTTTSPDEFILLCLPAVLIIGGCLAWLLARRGSPSAN